MNTSDSIGEAGKNNLIFSTPIDDFFSELYEEIPFDPPFMTSFLICCVVCVGLLIYFEIH